MQKSGGRCARQASRGAELLQGKWTVHILCVLCDGPARLSQLQRKIPRASKKALTASLRLLELSKLVLRRDLSTSVLHVEYNLSASTRDSVVALLDHLVRCASVANDDPL